MSVLTISYAVMLRLVRLCRYYPHPVEWRNGKGNAAFGAAGISLRHLSALGKLGLLSSVSLHMAIGLGQWGKRQEKEHLIPNFTSGEPLPIRQSPELIFSPIRSIID